MLMLATEPTATKAIIIAATWLTIIISVMAILVLVLVPHEAWLSALDMIRSSFYTLRGRLFSTRSKEDDQQ